jgi:hypothetical protein
MVLGFKKEFPWGGPTYFKEKILIGAGYGPPHPPKIHTIRAGDRWGAGMTIHMANGVRTKNYQQFNIGPCPYCNGGGEVCPDGDHRQYPILCQYCQGTGKGEPIEGLQKVISVQEIKFRHYNYYPEPGKIPKTWEERMKLEVMIVTIDGKKFEPSFINTLAINDGFSDILDFHKWFWPLKNFEGQIIHWTDFKY